MATWPASLPPPMITGYSVTDEPKLLRTALASGPDRLTRFTAHYMTTGTASVMATKQGVDDFRSMLSNSADGADWIDNVPLDTGQGNVATRARISSRGWTVDRLRQGTNWKITFQFETDQRNAP